MSEPETLAVIVRNPAARSAVARERLQRAAESLRPLGWRTDVHDTAGPGDARRIAGEAAAGGAAVVVACGGDGTVNEVVNGLAGARTALAVVPAGTANIWAKEALVPDDPGRALALLGLGRRVRVDVGLARIGDRERRFLLMCGVGLDARVVHDVEAHANAKRRLGRAAFALPAVRAALETAPARVALSFDGETAEAALLLAIAGNTRLYGGVAQLAAGARLDDGLLDLVTFEDIRPTAPGRALREARLVASALRGRLDRAETPGVTYRRARHIEFRPSAPLPVQVDGEYLGECAPEAPLVLDCLPAALEVVIAPRPNPLLGEA